jgi:hypothetical protein
MKTTATIFVGISLITAFQHDANERAIPAQADATSERPADTHALLIPLENFRYVSCAQLTGGERMCQGMKGPGGGCCSFQ